MSVMWTTLLNTTTTVVKYGTNSRWALAVVVVLFDGRPLTALLLCSAISI
jgi:hypothetical protein